MCECKSLIRQIITLSEILPKDQVWSVWSSCLFLVLVFGKKMYMKEHYLPLLKRSHYDWGLVETTADCGLGLRRQCAWLNACRVFGVSLPFMLVSPPGHVVRLRAPLASGRMATATVFGQETPWNSHSQEFNNDVAELSKPFANSTQNVRPNLRNKSVPKSRK